MRLLFLNLIGFLLRALPRGRIDRGRRLECLVGCLILGVRLRALRKCSDSGRTTHLAEVQAEVVVVESKSDTL